jgi:hypothetical protein
MQHVVGHADALTLVAAADDLENRSLGLGVNGDEVVLVVHLDAMAIGNLGTLAGEKRHAENHRRVDEILEIDVGSMDSNPRSPARGSHLSRRPRSRRDRNRERTSGANVTCSGRGSAPIAAPAPALPQSGLTRDYYADALVGATEVAQGVPPQIASASLDDLGDDGKRNFGRLDAVNVEACWRLQARQAISG